MDRPPDTAHPASGPGPGIPVVVQLGFAGSRQLFDAVAHPGIERAEFERAVQEHLAHRLRALPEELRLSGAHFFCGFSQLAVGADTLFTRACRDLGWPQRFLLPQHREEFLGARGSDGQPDFTDAERTEARELFDSPHVIHERVVSDSPHRQRRFQDVNLELVRVSDVVVCLTNTATGGRPGGTREVLEHAHRRGRPTLEIAVSVDEAGGPSFSETWRNLEGFAPPGVPTELGELGPGLSGMPAAADYYRSLSGAAGRISESKQRFFRAAALVIIGTHVLATGGAVWALKLAGNPALPWVLGGELVLLGMGLGTHLYLHRSDAARSWAMARLVAELARSGVALRSVSGYLGYLFTLPLPASLRPLLRTLNVLHLRETAAILHPQPQSDPQSEPAPWSIRRQAYVDSRLTDPTTGQIPYYQGKLRRAKVQHAIARTVFVTGSSLAIVAAAGKFWLECHCLGPAPAELHSLVGVLGVVAILLPVAAVAALSLAASFDLDARVHTFQEMSEFLRDQLEELEGADSDAALSALALETEARLLGETASWYSRRAFTGVA
jgi:hypothetical protein